MSEFEGKKLLILGGNPETIPLVEIANSWGIKTIVASARETDPAKTYAWKAYTYEGLDTGAVIKIATEEKVDGVLVGVADILVPMYCKVCDALDADMKREDLDKIVFPVMVKPVDNGGGVGMTVAYNEEELKRGVEVALENSHSKRFIVERYMQCDDMGMYYTFKDGYCSASCIYDRYTTDEQPGLSRVCLGGTYPSKHLDEYFERMHPNALRLFKEIGIENGVLMLSGFYENGEFYVYDTGFRLQGEAPHLLMKAIHGFDQREMLIRFALTGSMGDVDLKTTDDTRLRGKWAATLWFLLKEGKIEKIEGLDKLDEDERVVANIQRLHEGDTVLPEWIGNEKQVLTRMYLVCNSKMELADTLKYYMSTVKVQDENGNNMLLKGFDVNKALELK